MGNCCFKASIKDIKEVEVPTSTTITTLDQSCQTINIIEVTYNEGSLGLKLLPVNNLVVVNQLISEGHYCGQTEMYNSMVPTKKQIAKNMYIYQINGNCVLGNSYNEVLEMLRHPRRPLCIGFAKLKE